MNTLLTFAENNTQNIEMGVAVAAVAILVSVLVVVKKNI